MMSEQDFDLRLRHIEDQAKARRESAEAYRDQEMGRLFCECEWTQEKIADHPRIKKSRQWVEKRLRFGRFLTFATTCSKTPPDLSTLTEGRFRSFWSKTTGGTRGRGAHTKAADVEEQRRFREVLALLIGPTDEPAPDPAAAKIIRGSIRRAIVAVLEDGQWYNRREVGASMEESVRHITKDQVTEALRLLRTHPPRGLLLEAKHIGRLHQYRLVKVPEEFRQVEADRLVRFTRSVEPALEELDSLAQLAGGNLVHAISAGSLRRIAEQLRRAVGELTSKTERTSAKV